MDDVTPALIDGSDVLTDTASTVRSPYDDTRVGAVPVCDESHIDRAVAVALERHRDGAQPAHQRAEVLDLAAELLAGRVDEFARSITDESAKPISTSEIEVHRAIDTLRFSAAAARTFAGEVVPLDASSAGVGKIGYVMRVPIGVVGAISPFNFPLNLVCHKIAPAVAAGCPVVLKPASATPLTALRIVRLFEEAGLPSGWINVVTCSGAVANRLVEHDDVAMITFTGSPEVGWGIRAKAPRKKVGLELGNNAPIIVDASADVERAATRIAKGGYSFAGQSCISVQRVLAHRSVHDELVERLRSAVAELQVGDPLDPATDVSALITADEASRVSSWISESIDEGAELVCGGAQPDGAVLQPTVLDAVTPSMKVSAEELFGPAVGVSTFEELDDAVTAANATRYGLQAGIFTADLDAALAAAARLDFGGVLINEVPTWRADHQPYGGIRDSGNTREGPGYAVEEMTERRLIVMQPSHG